MRRPELYTCDEAFLTGTAVEAALILHIDSKPVGKGKPGPVTVEFQKEYNQVVAGTNAKCSK